jgi:hypothetical protein
VFRNVSSDTGSDPSTHDTRVTFSLGARTDSADVSTGDKVLRGHARVSDTCTPLYGLPATWAGGSGKLTGPRDSRRPWAFLATQVTFAVHAAGSGSARRRLQDAGFACDDGGLGLCIDPLDAVGNSTSSPKGAERGRANQEEGRDRRRAPPERSMGGLGGAREGA